MYQAYENLWKNMEQLQDNIRTVKDNDIKILAWKEMINTIYEKVPYFLVNVDSASIERLLNSVTESVDKLRENTKFADIKSSLDEITENVKMTEQRLDSASQLEEEK